MSDSSLTLSSAPAPLTDPSEEALRQVTDVIDDSWLKGQTYVKQYPLHSVAYAFGAGLILGILWTGCKACKKRA
jgi:hypothetical protein